MPEWLQLAMLVLKVSIILQVFATGLGTTWRDATYMFRHPPDLFRSILARNILVPAIAVLLIKVLSLHPAIAITIGALAVTPTPPLLQQSLLKAGARSEYVLGLMVSQALLAVIFVPLTIQVMNSLLGAHAHFGAASVMKFMLQTIFVPVGLGMLVSHFVPALRAWAPRLSAIGTVLLVIGAVPLLLASWKSIGALIGDGAVFALSIFIIASIAAGELVGGPSSIDRATLATASAARHPAVAFAIARENFPEQGALVAGAVLMYLVLRAILSIPFTRYIHRVGHPAHGRS